MTRRLQGIKEIREGREKADAERWRMLDRFKDHQAAVDREQYAREAALTAKTLKTNFSHSANASIMSLSAGDGAGAPINEDTAGELARALLELGVSAILQLKRPWAGRPTTWRFPTA